MVWLTEGNQNQMTQYEKNQSKILSIKQDAMTTWYSNSTIKVYKDMCFEITSEVHIQHTEKR